MTEGGFRVYNAGDTDPWTATGGAFPSTSIPPRPYMKRANAPSSPVDFGSASQSTVLGSGALCLSDVIVCDTNTPPNDSETPLQLARTRRQQQTRWRTLGPRRSAKRTRACRYKMSSRMTVFLTRYKMLIVMCDGPQCTDRHKTPLRHSLSPRRYQCPYNASAIERSLSSGSKSKFAGRYASCRSKLSFATADLGERSTHFAAA